jgi:hypothetical protein
MWTGLSVCFSFMWNYWFTLLIVADLPVNASVLYSFLSIFSPFYPSSSWSTSLVVMKANLGSFCFVSDEDEIIFQMNLQVMNSVVINNFISCRVLPLLLVQLRCCLHTDILLTWVGCVHIYRCYKMEMYSILVSNKMV